MSGPPLDPAQALAYAEKLVRERQELRERQASRPVMEANRLDLAEAHRQVGLAAISAHSPGKEEA